MPIPEFSIIDLLRDSDASFSRAGIVLGIGDDAAVMQVPEGQLLVASMDVLVADRHFPVSAPANRIAHRALAVNLSDLAAMAAEPFCFTLGLTLPESDPDWISQFIAGLSDTARENNCPLVGGDIASGPLSITIQVQGLVEPNSKLLRSGAQIGDKIYVTGTLGDAAVALLYAGIDTHLGADVQLAAEARTDSATARYCEARYYEPASRVAFAQGIAGIASAAIDISDGIMGDVEHLAQASGAKAQVDLDRLPRSRQLQESIADPWHQILLAACGGDDYELLFTVAEENIPALEAIAQEQGVAITCVGQMLTGSGIETSSILSGDNKIHPKAFQHFDDRP